MTTAALALNYIGAVTGAVGVLIAIYLQLISQKRCPPKYVLFYLTLGSGLMLSHTSGVYLGDLAMVSLRLTGYMFLIAVQIGSAYYIYQKLDGEESLISLEQMVSVKHR